MSTDAQSPIQTPSTSPSTSPLQTLGEFAAPQLEAARQHGLAVEKAQTLLSLYKEAQQRKTSLKNSQNPHSQELLPEPELTLEDLLEAQIDIAAQNKESFYTDTTVFPQQLHPVTNGPLQLLRLDLLPDPDIFLGLSPNQQEDYLTLAALPLDYETFGYPVTPNGTPIWERLPQESPKDFALFEQWIDLPRVAATAKNPQTRTPLRNVNTFAYLTETPQAKIVSLFRRYAWKFRAESYDCFIRDEHQRLKGYRLQDLETRKYHKAMDYLEKCDDYLEAAFQAPEHYNLKPSDVIKLRQSQSDVAFKVTAPPPAPTEVNITNNTPNQTPAIDASHLAVLDAETLQQAQDLIIKLTPREA